MYFSLFSGIQSRNVNLEEDLTVLIDYAKYQQFASTHRHPRDGNKVNTTNSTEKCADLGTEDYQKCGSKCILSCRYASLPSELTVSKDACDKNECIEGCFCKQGLVRHQDKCIPLNECPVRTNKAIEVTFNDPIPFWKHFGLFNRPMNGCGPKGCTQPIHIHNHNTAGGSKTF